MKTLDLKKSLSSTVEKGRSILKACSILFFFIAIAQIPRASAQAVLFDFDNAPQYTSLPLSQTVSGITAHFAATALSQGYSIQSANTMGFTPPGFGGLCIYPNSVYLTDLLISYDQAINDFSIMYSCQELGCDDAATMRVTAFMNGSFVGTNTKIASVPGTWPVDTLSCSFSQGFDSLVVHYDSPPPTCQDYGVIYLADNMRVTAPGASAIINPEIFIKGVNIPNPVSQSLTISFYLVQPGNINVSVHDITGRLIKNFFDGPLSAGEHRVNWNVNTDPVKDGVYFLELTGKNFSRSYKLVVVK